MLNNPESMLFVPRPLETSKALESLVSIEATNVNIQQQTGIPASERRSRLQSWIPKAMISSASPASHLSTMSASPAPFKTSPSTPDERKLSPGCFTVACCGFAATTLSVPSDVNPDSSFCRVASPGHPDGFSHGQGFQGEFYVCSYGPTAYNINEAQHGHITRVEADGKNIEGSFATTSKKCQLSAPWCMRLHPQRPHELYVANKGAQNMVVLDLATGRYKRTAARHIGKGEFVFAFEMSKPADVERLVLFMCVLAEASGHIVKFNVLEPSTEYDCVERRKRVETEGCESEYGPELQFVAKSAVIDGLNSLALGPDGLLYVPCLEPACVRRYRTSDLTVADDLVVAPCPTSSQIVQDYRDHQAESETKRVSNNGKQPASRKRKRGMEPEKKSVASKVSEVDAAYEQLVTMSPHVNAPNIVHLIRLPFLIDEG